eukprot:506156-Amorphochlora_amoeboformis.AAC.1
MYFSFLRDIHASTHTHPNPHLLFPQSARREKEEDTARRERQMELDEIKRIQLVEANSKSALDDNDSRAASEVEEAGEEAGEEDQDSDVNMY